VSVDSVIKRSGPRKLLAIDGGGVRAMIAEHLAGF
jgi:hypothetical protein